MTELISIPDTDLNNFITAGDKVAFAYSIDINSTNDRAFIDEVHIIYDKNDVQMQIDYHYKITVKEYEDGELVNTIEQELYVP